jgi:hypothetical protein
MRTQPLPSTTFPVQYSLSHNHFTPLTTLSSNKPQTNKNYATYGKCLQDDAQLTNLQIHRVSVTSRTSYFMPSELQALSLCYQLPYFLVYIIYRPRSYRRVNPLHLHYKANQLILYTSKVAVCSEVHTRHLNTLCRQYVEFFNVKICGTYSNH